MELPEYFTLNNGYKVPAIGLGTFQGGAGNAQVKSAVLLALRLGYRHIDGANAYGNEKEIGEAIKESGIPREEIFVTSKLAQTWHEPADVERALDVSLQDLQLDYVDLYLMHCRHVLKPTPSEADPIPSVPHAYKPGENNKTIRHPSGNGKPVIDYDRSRRYPETWQAMEKLVDSGKARSVGLSNFNVLKTKRILEVARIIPAVNQVELHPYLPQHKLLALSRDRGILLMAHQPLGGRPVAAVRGHADEPFPTEHPTIKEIANAMDMTPAQVCLSWAVQRGVPAVPKSSQEHHLAQNLQLKRLPEETFKVIDGLAAERGAIRFLDPSMHLGFDIFDEEHDQPVGNTAPWD